MSIVSNIGAFCENLFFPTIYPFVADQRSYQRFIAILSFEFAEETTVKEIVSMILLSQNFCSGVWGAGEENPRT
jgi:hypothetical protein